MFLDCGHAPTPDGIAAGYATLIDGRRVCYPCADDAQRRQVAQGNRFVGYLASDSRTVTTWTGGELARVRQTKPAGADAVSVWARTPDGRSWYGRGSGPGMVLSLRAVRS